MFSTAAVGKVSYISSCNFALITQVNNFFDVFQRTKVETYIYKLFEEQEFVHSFVLYIKTLRSKEIDWR